MNPSLKRRKLDVSGEEDLSAGSFEDSEEDEDFDNSGQGNSSNHQQLFRIERKIKEGGELNKRERRLLQNRKSALKCRLKKQEELEKMKEIVERLSQENRELKEKVRNSNRTEISYNLRTLFIVSIKYPFYNKY